MPISNDKSHLSCLIPTTGAAAERGTPGRPRSDKARKAVPVAALELVAEVGYVDVVFPGLAAPALA